MLMQVIETVGLGLLLVLLGLLVGMVLTHLYYSISFEVPKTPPSSPLGNISVVEILVVNITDLLTKL